MMIKFKMMCLGIVFGLMSLFLTIGGMYSLMKLVELCHNCVERI